MEHCNDIETIINNVSKQLEENTEENNDRESSYTDDLNSERQNIINTHYRGIL